MGLANVHWEGYYQIWSVNRTIQCALGMGLANVLYEWDYWASQCTLGMGQANVPWEWDYPICPGNGTSQ